MTCPRPEVLSRWADGTLEPIEARRVQSHAARCGACRVRAEELRGVGRWLRGVVDPGPECLSESAMAALLEGRLSSDHIRGCPRCAAEFASLRQARKPATRIFRRRRPAAVRWIAAAAVLVAAGILGWVTMSGPAPETVRELAFGPGRPERVRDLPDPPKTAKAPPPAPEPLPPRSISVPPPPPLPPPEVAEIPAPAEIPVPVVRETKPTVVEPPAAKAVALEVRGGALATLANGKWERTRHVEEGMALRAEGRTSVEFAQARLTFDASSRFAFEGDSLALAEGGVSAEILPGSGFTLSLEGQRIVPQASGGRVLMFARPDRVVVDEGFARAGDLLLAERVEHHLRKGKLEPQRRRSLPAAARPRETVSWKIDYSNVGALRQRLINGTVANHPEGRALLSGAPADPAHCGSQIGYLGNDDRGFILVKAGTALRFRYFLVEPAPVELAMWNVTKGENFNKPLDAVAGQWTTVTLPFRDLPANPGGKKVACEPGDRFRGMTWFVGKAGTSPQMLIDQLEIIELEGR